VSSKVARMFTVSLVVAAIGAAGCGSKSKTTSSSSSASSAKSTTTVKTYRSGEFCTSKKEAVYKAQGFKCAMGKGGFRLEKS
jgi:uncharacterized protein YceK